MLNGQPCLKTSKSLEQIVLIWEVSKYQMFDQFEIRLSMMMKNKRTICFQNGFDSLSQSALLQDSGGNGRICLYDGPRNLSATFKWSKTG